MKDQEHFAGRFSAEVDRLLERQGRAEDSGPPSEYDGMLALAEQLAALDFSANSNLQPRLRRRLLNRLEAERSATRRQSWWHRRPILPRSKRALGVLTALAALVALVGWTPAGQAVAQAVGNLIHEIRWSHTTVQQLPPGSLPTATANVWGLLEAQPAAGQVKVFSFQGRDFYYTEGGLARNEVVSLSQAIVQAGFDLQVPTYLPDGFALSKVRLLGSAPYDVFMIYEGPGGRLGLYQSLVGVVSEQHRGENVIVVESRAVGVATDRTLEEVRVGAAPAALIDDESLAWEANNVSLRLIGPGLGAETLIRIAESLAPIR
jgi:hypothetical protein